MNVSVRWLRELAPDLDGSPEEIAHRLAMYGAAVDEILDVGAPLGDIVIGRVIEAGRHPNADRLSLCRVDAGGDALQVVCGAPNVRTGAFYPFAPVGATLPGGVKIRRARIRGSDSEGMLCSPRELGLGRDHEGILELHGTFTPGEPFIDAVGLRDVRLVLDVTPNRPDLLSHWGVARELSDRGEAGLTLPSFHVIQGNSTSISTSTSNTQGVRFVEGTAQARAEGIEVRVEDVEGCPRYYGVVLRGVRIGPSPEWLASRLRAIGQRPINNVVDATNWVLHELGQPLHAFDLDRLGTTVVVRRARPGERLETLDGQKRTLDPAMLVIADANRPVALAGVMGGVDTEVRDETRNLLLECALFDPRTTRATRRSVGLTTDASQRFERGVDPDGMERALLRALNLIVTVAGGEAVRTAPFVDAGIAPPAPVRLRVARVERVLGVRLAPSQMTDLLRPLGFDVQRDEADALRIGIPGHRRYDVAREEDLIEEVARRYGYDAFPDELRAFRPGTVPHDAMADLEDALRTTMVAHGFLEARSATFVPEVDGDVALLNPLSAAESRLRRSLLPGLLRRVEANFNRGLRDVRLFEIGTAFHTDGANGLPRESTRIAAAFTGHRAPVHWAGRAEMFDIWDARGLAEELAEKLGLTIRPGTHADAPLAESEAWGILSEEEPAGVVGRLMADAIDAPAWAAPVYVLEISITPVHAAAVPTVYRAIPVFPAVERDLALLVPGGMAADAVRRAIVEAGRPLLERVTIFDVYAGLGRSEVRSIAFRLRFQASDRTLVDEEVDSAVDGILRRLKEEHDVERRI